MTEFFKKIAQAKWFQNFITIVILLAGVSVGMQTYAGLVASYGSALNIIDWIIVGIFVVEIVVKIGAEGKQPWKFFYDSWNVFDFLIVASAFMPIGGQYLVVLRLLRLLRVLRLVRALPKLQILVSALLKSIPSMAYVSMLLGLVFYMYGVAGTFMFSANDPVHFGTLQKSLLSLFQTVTLEGWADLLRTQMAGCANFGYDSMQALCTASHAQPIAAVIYFISFILLGTMIILNLFVGVIMNGMEEAQNEQEKHPEEGGVRSSLHHDLHVLNQKLQEVQSHLNKISTSEVVSASAKETTKTS